MEVQTIIKAKMKEHQTIVTQITADMDEVKKRLAKLKDLADGKKDLMVETVKLMALKDRMMFHKAAVLVLQDLEQELKNVGRKQEDPTGNNS